MGEEKQQSTIAKPVITVWQNRLIRRWAIRAGALLIAFLLGFLPMWLRVSDTARDRDAAQQELRRSQIQNAISAAIIDSRRAEYESARESASLFFTEVRAQLDSTSTGIFSASQKEQLRVLMSPRDEIITLLSRNDPASVEKLVEVYVAYRKAVVN